MTDLYHTHIFLFSVQEASPALAREIILIIIHLPVAAMSACAGLPRFIKGIYWAAREVSPALSRAFTGQPFYF